MKPKLTISLLASKQIHAVRKCLDSLIPILMGIPSELIVVDTSKNEKVRELALQYTSQIIPFHWCNDFSKARNAGLQKAHGEWFLFIDDDEWFEDPSEIIEFFSSGEYLQYNSGRYIVRNYMDWMGTNYVDARLNRMVCITPETQFKNPIHEYLRPFAEPIKMFSSYVHHYGYAGKVQKTKTDRNVPLLKKELKEHKSTAHNYTQLTQEYISTHEFKKAEKYARKCLELNITYPDLEVSWCVAYLPYIIYSQEEYQRAWKTGKEMLRHSQCTEIAALRIYMDLIGICGHLNNHEKDIIIYTKAYHQYLNQMDIHPEKWPKQAIGELGEHQIKKFKDIVHFLGLKAAVQIKDAESARFFLSFLPWGGIAAEKFYPYFSNILREKKKEVFLLNLFENMDGDSENPDPLILIFKSRSAYQQGNFQKSEDYLQRAVESRQIYVLMEAALLIFQAKGKLSLESLFSQMDISQLGSVSKYLTQNAEADQLSHWIAMVKSSLSSFPVQSLFLLTSFQEKLLIEGILEIEDSELLAQTKQYCQWVKEYTVSVYSEQIFASKDSSFTPPDYRFALRMEQIFQDWEDCNYPQVLKGLRDVINIYKPLCGVIRRLLSMISEEINQPAPTNPEFLALANQVKQTVQYLLQENRCEEALPLIQQLSTLLPKDLEVVRLRQELWSQMGN